MNDLTVIILTKNEEANLKQCIRSVTDIADRIIVVDSGSTDRTVEIAKEFGAEVVFHPFEHYAAQFNWALEHLNIETVWVYRLDADEEVPPELASEIVQQCAAHREDQVNGFLMKHKMLFLGRYLTHGGAYPFIKMTVFKPKYARFENRAMGEHVVLDCGEYITLKQDCIHHDCKNLTAFVDKHNAYATREVLDYFTRQKMQQAELYSKAQSAKKLRDGLYYRLPPFIRAKLYYWYRYYIRLGFLDGTPGRIYAFIQAYFYRYLVDAKLYEASQQDKMSGDME